MSIEAMKLALEALLEATQRFDVDTKIHRKAITAIRQAIEQAQKQEPVARDAWMASKINTDEDIVYLIKKVKEAIHYPSCWDTAGYPTLQSALHELTAWFKASGCETCKTEQHARNAITWTAETGYVFTQPEQEPVVCPDDFELLPVDPTPEMKSAAIEVELFDHDTGKDYVLSWEEAEQIYSAMLNAAPTPPQRQPLTDEQKMAELLGTDLETYRRFKEWEDVNGIKGEA